MNTEIIAEWTIVTIIFASMVAYSFFLGEYIVRAVLRWLGRNRTLIYRKWGVERDLFYAMPLWGFIVLGIVVMAFAVVTFLLSAAMPAVFIQKTSFAKEIW